MKNMSFTPCIHILLNKKECVVGGTFSGLPQYLFTSTIGTNNNNIPTNPPPPPPLVQKFQDSAPNQRNSNQKSNISSIRTDKLEEGERSSCRTCLYTGVATCTGISLYFASLYSELPSEGPRAAVKDVIKQKRFLLGGSVIWAAAGVYRLYLG